MATMAFDALKFIDQLEKAGYSEHQAKETAKAYQYAHADLELVSQQDLGLIRQDLKALEQANKHDLKELGLALDKKLSDLVIRLSGIIFATMTVGVSVLLWFINRWHI